MKNLPAGLMDPNFEFFCYHGEVFMLSSGRVTPFNKIPQEILDRIHDDLLEHPDAIEALIIMGITHPVAMLEKWLMCRYGLLDSQADLSTEGITISEYPDCPYHSSCRFEGTLCQLVTTPQGKLSPREIQVIKGVAEGIPNKCIGDELGISRFTVNTHIRNIQQKTGSLNKAQVVAWASENNIL